MWFVFETVLAPIVPFENKLKNTVTKSIEKIATKDTPSESKPIAPGFNKSKYSTASADSIWAVVNKSHHLNPTNYSPTDLITTNGATISQKAQADFEALILAASKNGIALPVVSSYRSYYTQQALYNNYVAIYGQIATDTFSARAGYSEHQTGLTIDFGSNVQTSCNLDTCYGQTVEGKWLAQNAYKYGFLLRYTTAKQGVTGYKDEPWHYRYIGKELAIEMKKLSIITLEEFFGVSGGTIYI